MVGGLIAAFVGALSAYIFNYLHWQTVDRVKKVEKLANIVVNNITELEAKAVSYWLTNAEPQNEQKRALEIELKSRCFINQKLIHGYLTKLPETVPVATRIYLVQFTKEVFDLATGGDFESATRMQNPKTAYKLSSKCTSARIKMLQSMHNYEKKGFWKNLIPR